MAKQKYSGLGRGLDSLISGASEVMSATQQGGQQSHVDTQNILIVPIDSIIPNPRQPRRIFREDDPKLLELSASIKEHGLLQPIVVTRLDTLERLTPTTDITTPESNGDETHTETRPKKRSSSWFFDDDSEEANEIAETSSVVTLTEPELPAYNPAIVQYQIIAGERRWRASRLAGLSKVPVVLKEVTPLQMLELALIENIQRADLNPIEEALAYSALIQDFGLTQEMVAKQVGKDRSTVTNSLRLLQLAPKVRDALVNQPENFSEGHARALIGIPREEDQVTAMSKIIALRLNVRQAEELAASIKAQENVEEALERIRSTPQRDSEVEELESHFRDALMVKVQLKKNAKGKGTLVLHFNDQEELERLYSKLVKHEEL